LRHFGVLICDFILCNLIFAFNIKGGLMKYYLVCNWKMNPYSFNKAKELIISYNKLFRSKKKKSKKNLIEIIICPPYLYFQLVDERRSKAIKLGAQDIFWESKGPYTGKISARMIKEFGAEYVIIGHSELRRLGDTENLVNMKIREALKRNIIPLVCIGYDNYLKELKSVVNSFSADEINRMIFAYEPIEAIGTGMPASIQEVERAVKEMKKTIYKRFRRKYFLGLVRLGGKKSFIPRPPILYGGSVNPENCEMYIHNIDIQGFVIGKESLKPESIKKIAEKIASY